MFYKVKSCSLLHHMKLQHLSLMLFSFTSIKESPKATTIYPVFTWEVPRVFELFFAFLESKSTTHTPACHLQKVKPETSGLFVQVTAGDSARDWQHRSQGAGQ